MPVDMENTTYFWGMNEERSAISLSIYEVFFFLLPCPKEDLKRLIRDTEI